MFDGIPPDGNGDDMQTVHLPCPICQTCNHVYRERPMDAEMHIGVYQIQVNELDKFNSLFPINCTACNQEIHLVAVTVVGVSTEATGESDNATWH